MITAAQIRAARAAIGWTAADLAAAAKFSRQTIVKIEAAEGLPSANVTTLAAIKACLEAEGIEFTTAEDKAHGIVIRRPK